MDCADIYLRPDTSYVRLRNDEVMPAVALLIYGVTYALTIMLTTDDLSSVTKDRVYRWIEIVHGPLTSQCEGSQAQFELLLDIVLMYCAFALGRHGLGEAEFDLFADRLIKTVSELHPFERADNELAEFVGWLHVNFPKSVFDTNDLDLSAQTLARAGQGLANELQRLTIIKHEHAGIDDIHTAVDPAAFAAASDATKATPLTASNLANIPSAPKTPKQARRGPGAGGADSDAESDGAGSDMPSLETVDCSSCGDAEDSDRDGF
ncbi:uncharacterized protein TRAVEDRAFT_48104 [Trametes versicolor FP-101664 SS1]|uniref:uncharacterized protein n=1 Tax=Trametes versicolor (strain FP-101664) TaxID=717944 RepID=UPI0004623D29|nr:uncharacterized protein TRAVEDRAFT_48104 [Trametes versicolor FP-101664 SS1]EIW58970.1 hypothetical protein TRAVEDRAFT_48104 [Trametes versicolor FP-101664 SS1]